MCLKVSSVLPWHSWNWSGDEIVHKPIIPASRTIPGTRKRYQIDIREFLTTTNNAVVSEALGEVIGGLLVPEQALFRSHAPGSFDFRVDAIVRYMGTLRYRRPRGLGKAAPDAWLFPDETLAQRGGDCEDLSFLLAALLMAAGVSRYCVRVALGTVEITLPRGPIQMHDHCWVMYQNESGVWEILEALAATASGAAKAKQPARLKPQPATNYLPHYVFNSDHLWLIRSPLVDPARKFEDYCRRRRNFWSRFDPSFTAGVHSTLFDLALKGLVPDSALSRMKRKSLWLDANIFSYDPRDHFDSGYIDASWERVQQNLARFGQDNSDWESFGAAGHAIADFYAHSSYLHFAELENPAASGGRAAVYRPGQGLVATPSYTSAPADLSLPPFDLTSADFSMNTRLWPGTKPEAAAQWAGHLLSGRYAQLHDPKAGFFEGFTSIPRELTQAPDYAAHGSPPHHDEIAVDSDKPGKRHRLYRPASSGPEDRRAYANQFRWRVNTAIEHLRAAFQAH